MGLLDKALFLDDKNISYSPEISFGIEYLQSKTAGLDFPSILFSKIKDELKISKGALLLPEEESIYVPWAETGFDQTTSRRIRIPERIIEKIKNWNEFNFLELKNNEIDIMSDFFSYREFSVTQSIIVSPLFFESQIIAILFISEGDILSWSLDEKFKNLKLLSDQAGPLLYHKRDSIFTKFNNSHSDEKKEDIINKYIEQSGENRFLLLSIQLKGYIEYISANDSNSITFRIKQDILRLVKNLISEKGLVLNSISNSILILLKDDRIEEAELFVHQIGLSLSYFYKIDKHQFKTEYSIIKYPEDGKTATELLNILYSQ